MCSGLGVDIPCSVVEFVVSLLWMWGFRKPRALCVAYSGACLLLHATLNFMGCYLLTAESGGRVSGA